jgi:opacity protein-like surface antigen
VLRGSAVPAYEGEPVAIPPRFVPGSPIYRRWEGVYFGGQLGIANAGLDLSNSTQGDVASILRNDVVGTHVSGWTTLARIGATQGTYGGFVGYNSQWDGNLIVGMEANYNRILSRGLGGSATDSTTANFNDDTGAPATHHYFYNTTVTSNASAQITDYATARLRAGFIMDRFMPYAFIGAAIARMDIVRNATVSYVRHDIPDATTPPTPPITPEADFVFGPRSHGINRKGVFAYGYAGGLGFDYAILPNLFVRAEWEYVQLFEVDQFKIHLNSGRVGVGVKF